MNVSGSLPTVDTHALRPWQPPRLEVVGLVAQVVRGGSSEKSSPSVSYGGSGGSGGSGPSGGS
jgi:hypothetical protein